MTELFTRHGAAHTGAVQHTEKGAPFFVRSRMCGRCGGAGGSEKWAHTGWTCYDCGGNGTRGTEAVKLYTAEKLAKLNAAAAKKAEAKAAKAAAAAAQAKAEADARRDGFLAVHGELLNAAEAFAERSEFIADVTRKARERNELTEGQAVALQVAIARIEASDAKKAASGFVGKVGERMTLKVTLERMAAIETQFGAMYIATMRDEAGNAIVSKGRFVPMVARWNREIERWEVGTDPFVIKATVKEHARWNEEKQTVVQRVAELAEAA